MAFAKVVEFDTLAYHNRKYAVLFVRLAAGWSGALVELGMVDRRWGLPEVQEGRPAPDTLVESREKLTALVQIQLSCAEVPVREIVLGGVACLDIGSVQDPILLYAHGGGFRMGEPGLWAGLASRIAKAGSLRVVLPDYRLAPEHPFPAGLADLCEVLGALIKPGDVWIAGGDSAGGGLAVSLVLAAASAGLTPPAGLFLLSPWLDLTLTSSTYASNSASDPMFSRASAVEAAAHYLGDRSPETILASPGVHFSSAFPPVLMFASASESLLGDALAFSTRQAELGGAIELIVRPSQPHVWPIMTPGSDETRVVIDRIGAFARTVPGRTAAIGA